MNTNNHRRTVRLKEYNYSRAGGYFVTICTHNKEPIFGQFHDHQSVLNKLGDAVRTEWLKTAELRETVSIDEFIVMPNHFHGIIMLIENHLPISQEGTALCAPTERGFGESTKGSLSTIIGAFKSASTRQINLVRKTPGAPVWQRSFYEHVIRDENDLANIRKYIKFNPQKISY